MSEGPASESPLPPELTVTSPTEASNTWRVNYSPSLQQVLVGTTALLVFAIGWSQGHTDIETSKIAFEQGLFSLAVLKGMLGIAEVTAGISGGIAGGVWAKRDNDKQLNANPKPQ